MKKIVMFAVAAVMFCTTAMAKKADPVTVESGSLAVVKQEAKATVVYDYSNLVVSGMSLDDFLASQTDKFLNDWDSVIVPYSEQMFSAGCSAYLNRAKFLVVSEGDADYKIVLHLTYLDLGNIGANFNPFAGMKGGGATVSGTIDFVNNATGETVCTVKFNEFKGLNGYNDKDRWGSAYLMLMQNVGKIAKKTK